MSTEPISWVQAMPRRWEWEIAAMCEVAPDLSWSDDRLSWQGLAPLWPFQRPQPAGLSDFLDGLGFELAIVPREVHPAVAPRVWPIDPVPELDQCTLHRWHVNGDGTICQMQDNYTWSGAEPCAALIPKATGWFLEFVLMTAGLIETMTVNGIETSDELDHLFAATPAPPP